MLPIAEALTELGAFEDSWGGKLRAVARLWRGNRDNIIPFFQRPPKIRQPIATTYVIESLGVVMRTSTRQQCILPNGELAHRKPARHSFLLMLGEERVPLHAL